MAGATIHRGRAGNEHPSCWSRVARGGVGECPDASILDLGLCILTYCEVIQLGHHREGPANGGQQGGHLTHGHQGLHADDLLT